MIAEKTSKVPSWLRAVICAVAICVFPIGLVYAQDFEAVERRLGGAVEAGELSLEQANMAFAKEIEAAMKAGKLSREDTKKKLIEMRREMFEEKSGDERGDREMEGRRKRYEQVTKRIKAAIESGDMSAEEGEKKLIELRKEIFGGDK